MYGLDRKDLSPPVGVRDARDDDGPIVPLGLANREIDTAHDVGARGDVVQELWDWQLDAREQPRSRPRPGR